MKTNDQYSGVKSSLTNAIEKIKVYNQKSIIRATENYPQSLTVKKVFLDLVEGPIWAKSCRLSHSYYTAAHRHI